MKRLLFFVALGSVFCATNGMAADLVYNQLDFSPAVSKCLDCPQCPPMLDSVYIGLNAGYDSYRVGQSTVINGSILSVISRQVTNASGPMVGIFAGYGRNFHGFYYAGEIFANSSGAQDTFNYNTYQSNFNLRYSVGASLIPGIMVNRVGLVYLRLGYVRSLIGVSETGLPPGPVSLTQFENGLSVGVGIETALTYHLHLRLEALHTQYGGFNSLRSTDYSPSNTEGSVGLLYHFNVF